MVRTRSNRSVRKVKHRLNTNTVRLALVEIGRRQRAGLMPTADGRYVHACNNGEFELELSKHSVH